MRFEGRAWVFGDHIDTDVIIPARYLVSTDPAELSRHCMEPLDPEFASKVRPGDILVAGENFGSGSSREHAPMAIKGLGVGCVVAASFARIFFRNALNIGLAVVECPEAVAGTETGDVLWVDPLAGEVANRSRGEVWRARPYPEFLVRLIQEGGLVPYVRGRLGAR